MTYLGNEEYLSAKEKFYRKFKESLKKENIEEIRNDFNKLFYEFYYNSNGNTPFYLGIPTGISAIEAIIILGTIEEQKRFLDVILYNDKDKISNGKDFAKVNNIQITGYIDGLAASAASFLILCASKVVMGIGALFMIHNPLTYAYGNSIELQKQIQLLDTVKESILDIYCTKSKLSRKEISEKMNGEKWYRASEALEAGFVDEIIENDNSLENIKNISNDVADSTKLITENFFEKSTSIKKNVGGFISIIDTVLEALEIFSAYFRKK